MPIDPNRHEPEPVAEALPEVAKITCSPSSIVLRDGNDFEWMPVAIWRAMLAAARYFGWEPEESFEDYETRSTFEVSATDAKAFGEAIAQLCSSVLRSAQPPSDISDEIRPFWTGEEHSIHASKLRGFTAYRNKGFTIENHEADQTI